MYRVTLQYQPYIPRVIAFLAVVCALCAFIYGFFLLEAVAHAAARDSAESQIQTITKKLSALEAQYLAATQSLTPARAQELGYVVPQSVTAVFKQGSDRVLSLAGKSPVQ